MEIDNKTTQGNKMNSTKIEGVKFELDRCDCGAREGHAPTCSYETSAMEVHNDFDGIMYDQVDSMIQRATYFLEVKDDWRKAILAFDDRLLEWLEANRPEQVEDIDEEFDKEAFDEECKRERAMESAMAHGVQGWNDYYG